MISEKDLAMMKEAAGKVNNYMTVREKKEAAKTIDFSKIDYSKINTNTMKLKEERKDNSDFISKINYNKLSEYSIIK